MDIEKNLPLLNRVPRFDERSRAHGVASHLLAAKEVEPRSYTWGCDVFLDQGKEGACVGFAWAHEIAARPVVLPADEELAHRIYERAKRIDEFAGEDYEGTSVLAGAKAVKELGRLESYSWAFTLNEALTAISRIGPAVLGLNWHASMFEPNDKGYLEVTGAPVGGHCILAVGVSLKRQAIRLHNSWGPEWGDNGGCWLSFEDFDKLRRAGGEVCIPVGRR